MSIGLRKNIHFFFQKKYSTFSKKCSKRVDKISVLLYNIIVSKRYKGDKTMKLNEMKKSNGFEKLIKADYAVVVADDAVVAEGNFEQVKNIAAIANSVVLEWAHMSGEDFGIDEDKIVVITVK
jgi:hypothetical protein